MNAEDLHGGRVVTGELVKHRDDRMSPPDAQTYHVKLTSPWTLMAHAWIELIRGNPVTVTLFRNGDETQQETHNLIKSD